MNSRLRLLLTSTVAVCLSSAALTPLFEGWSWLFPVATVIVVVIGVCELARRIGTPQVLVPAVGFVALLLLLIVTNVGDLAPYGFVPTPGALSGLGQLIDSGLTDVSRYAAPVSPNPAILLLVTGGMGLVALAADTFAVTFRRPALAGLPLLALYGIPAGVDPHGVPWTAFALGAAGYLGLLLAESRERLLRWGRPLADQTGSSGETPLLALGRRIGLSAVAAAVALPLLVPGLNSGVLDSWGSGTGVGGGKGKGGLTTAVNPIITLHDDLIRKDKRPILRFSTTSSDAPYIRLVVLDAYDGTTWAPRTLRGLRTNAEKEIRAPWFGDDKAIGKATGHNYISVDKNFSSVWLPMPFPAAKVNDASGSWVYDPDTLNTYSRNRNASGLTYSVDSYDTSLTSADVEDLAQTTSAAYRPDQRYLDTPGVSDEVALLAQSKTAAATSAYAKALALQNYLRTNYFYSETAPEGVGEKNLENFLFSTKRGYCTHFATAMAVMARTLGIPSRVAVGFLPGVTDGKLKNGQKERVVTSSDTHAWPELYFPGAGWLRFEPTAGNGTITPAWAPSDIRPVVAPSGIPAVGRNNQGAATASPGVDESAGAGVDREDKLSKASADAGGQHGLNIPWRFVLLVPLVLALLLLPAAWRVWSRRRRWATARTPGQLVDAAWSELCASLIDRGGSVDSRETPRQVAERLSKAYRFDAPAREAMTRLALATERARYARSVGETAGLRHDTEQVIGALDAWIGGGERLRARLLPASTVSVVHRAGARTADVFDALDAAGARLARASGFWRTRRS